MGRGIQGSIRGGIGEAYCDGHVWGEACRGGVYERGI